MDEALEDLIQKVQSGLNAEAIADKDRVFIGLHNYLAGLQDGIRFGRPSPWTAENPRIACEGSRIIGS